MSQGKRRAWWKKHAEEIPAPAVWAGGDPRACAPGDPSLRRTVLVAILAPAIVFLLLAALSSDTRRRTEPIGAWLAGGRTLVDPGDGVRLAIGPQAVPLFHPFRERGARFSVLAFDLYLQHPVEPSAKVFYRNTAAGEKDYRTFDFSSRVERAGWNPIAVTSDEAPGLHQADEVGFLLASPAVPNRIAVRGARLEAFPFPARAANMLGALFQHRPLVASSINAVPSQRVAGRGFAFLLWTGGAGALALLLLRRLLLHEPASLLAHAAITAVCLYALADARNGVDHFLNAREAAAMRLASPTMDEYLARREEVFPWFADAVRALRERGGSDHRALLRVRGPLAVVQAVRRAWYYAQPAREAAGLADADVVLSWGEGPDPLAGAAEWIRAARLPSGLIVYERRR